VGTKRMVDAALPQPRLVWRLRKGFTNCPGTSFTSWPWRGADGSADGRRRRPPCPPATRHVSEANHDLASRHLLTQPDRPALVEADQVERVLANVDTDRRDRAGCWRMTSWDGSCALVEPLWATLRSTAGPSHQRTKSRYRHSHLRAIFRRATEDRPRGLSPRGPIGDRPKGHMVRQQHAFC
jgi:hypothetical protein